MRDELDIVPFAGGHLRRLELQGAQAAARPALADAAYAAELVQPDLSYSAVLGGRIVGCAGIVPLHDGVGRAWALIGPVPPAAWSRITRAAHRVLMRAGELGFRRVEATVDSGFGQGCRWMRLLGFELEGLMRAYGPGGRDHFLYARLGRARLLGGG